MKKGISEREREWRLLLRTDLKISFCVRERSEREGKFTFSTSGPFGVDIEDNGVTRRERECGKDKKLLKTLCGTELDALI